jgi:large conductance mechanosensitive channel
MWQDFKAFAFKGNVIDMAVGVVIGAAFGGIVKNLVDNLIMPPLGLLVGGLDFNDFYVVLKHPPTPGTYTTAEAIAKAGGVVMRYGLFINAVIGFFIVAIAIFLLVQGVTNLKKRFGGPEVATTRECPQCLSTIPVKALRCAHCTSLLTSDVAPKEAA